MGFVTVTKKGMQVAGGGDPSRFRITFYVAKDGLETNPPSLNKHMTVLKRLVRDHGYNVRAMRAWLKRQVQQSGVGGRRISKPASTLKAGTKI